MTPRVPRTTIGGQGTVLPRGYRRTTRGQACDSPASRFMGSPTASLYAAPPPPPRFPPEFRLMQANQRGEPRGDSIEGGSRVTHDRRHSFPALTPKPPARLGIVALEPTGSAS